MNEMYLMSIDMHNIGIYGILLVIGINFFVTYKTTSIAKLRRFMVIFTPMGSVMLGFVIFTGVIMMAAKHLDFTIQNIIMIIVSIALIVLEAKRSKALRYITKDEFDNYKLKAYKILLLEAIITIITAILMYATIVSAV
jgi:hypothetical protein